MFVNRTRELAQLATWWSSPSGRLAVVWGRRRVGKTALIRHFSQDLRCITHTGAGRAAPAELRMLARQAEQHAAAGVRDLHARPFTDWDDALDHLALLAADEPVLLVLDEFPELAASSPELPNVLRAFLERSMGLTQLRIVLCGSAVRYMRNLGEERRPLYGRMDLSLQVHPFAPWEAALLLPELSAQDRALVYGLLGGVPLYLSWWDQNGTVEENLTVLAGQPGARLLTEGELVLATESEAGDFPAMVLHAIAAGATKHSEIKDAIGAEPTRTLDRLVSLRLVEKMRPVTEPEGTKRKLYRISDQFLYFYLGILQRYRTEIDAGLGPSIMPVIRERLDQHLGPVWESAFRQHLRRLGARGELGGQIVAVGSFWTADGQNEIDAVVLAGITRTPVLIGEAKWARQVDGPRRAADLRRKLAALPGVRDEPRLALAARESVRSAPDGALVVTAADIFSD
ncbi:MAG TPA: ATP-binding protein [Actinocrinis sp.]|nr:ATP-binding protein [Actinocrinis sp.]